MRLEEATPSMNFDKTDDGTHKIRNVGTTLPLKLPPYLGSI